MTATGIRSVTDIFDRSSGSTPDIWRKFIGEDVPGDVPDLIDYSYAGYKNGEEPIPDVTGTIYDVITYGAIPNDGASDTQAIRDALSAAQNGGIVFFPPGQYDILRRGDSKSKFTVGRIGGSGNIIIRGSGAQGASKNGTTIKMHNNTSNNDLYDGFFKAAWQHNGSDHKTSIVGSFPRGTKHFDVEDSSHLVHKQFIVISASRLLGNDWAQHSSRPKSEMISTYTNIRSGGIDINEFHEIDRIDGNRIFIKAPTLTPLNSNYSVYWKDLQTNIGFEDIHFDGNFQESYEHLEQGGRNWISLSSTAHSWVQRCRFSNTINSVWVSGAYASSVISIIQDGRAGHYTVAITGGSTYCFIGLVEDFTDNGVHHGIDVQSKPAGNVIWGIGGPRMKGPDTHGSQPRHTLFDNYYSRNHQSSGGAKFNLPHHLDGYTRWNNVANGSGIFDLWNPGGWRFAVTQANMIGYMQNGGSSPRDAYVEGFGSVVYPNSLYEAQLQHRLGYLPAWINNSKEMHNEFFGSIFGGLLPPPLEGRTKIVSRCYCSNNSWYK